MSLSKKDAFLEKWLTEFSNNQTKKNYRTSLNHFKTSNNIADLEEYVNSSPDVASDMRTLLAYLNGRPSKTVSSYANAVKVFFQDNGIKLKDEDWKKIRRRGHFPKRVKAETRDKAPTKKQIKRILNYVDIKGKALFLFLLSSGCRVGETLELKEHDFNFDSEPPKVFISGNITKGGVGERTVFFSFEARDAIKDWLSVRNQLTKKNGNSYESDKVFPFSYKNAHHMWRNACKKAGLTQRDDRTGNMIYHIHGLRKFFRSKIGLDLDVVNALLGHLEYLDESYLRQEQSEVAKAYLDSMPNISVYEMQNEELKEKTLTLEEENRRLKEKMKQQDARLEQIENLLAKMVNGKQ